MCVCVMVAQSDDIVARLRPPTHPFKNWRDQTEAYRPDGQLACRGGSRAMRAEGSRGLVRVARAITDLSGLFFNMSNLSLLTSPGCSSSGPHSHFPPDSVSGSNQPDSASN
ncbi:unnamed protein product [Protopolystoma xenopodis]|uniref:Uncharacterized protein n=1 Tax=Protopolystoma xenopodis TaxID=117903 RepID=A0A448XJM3_9PLAT|nr:unnamed protein product [Protopolystoma xenopodis]